MLVLAVAVFALVSLYPALAGGTRDEHERALFGLTVLGSFMIAAAVFAVAINDSHVEIDDEYLHVRFEAFFATSIRLSDIVAIRAIDPRPHWRYRFGLSTNFEDRVACSHGGQFVDIQLAEPKSIRLWPRNIPVTRLWLAVREHDAFLEELHRATVSGVEPRELAA